MSDMTHNSFQDCDEMFIPEFKELLDYSVEKFNALHHVDEEDSETELASLPLQPEPVDDVEEESFGGEYYQ